MPLFEDAGCAFGLVGDSPAIHRVLRFIRKLKNDRSPVLLLGESGTGKELVARAIHEVSPARRGACVAVNAAALPPTLIESELFGHARGSFTGATAARRGLIEQAHGGTLFLDEIGEFPLEMQAKLLRTLEEKQIRPVGSDRSLGVDFRLIAATNSDLEQEVAQGRFRADLFYRLNVLTLRLPSLRDRREDIPMLARHFLRQYAARPIEMSDAILQFLMRYDWPGNVRQLENCVQRMVALASSSVLDIGDLPTQLRNALEAAKGLEPRQVAQPQILPLVEQEKLAIQHALEVSRGQVPKAAKILGIGKTTLYRKLREYGLERARPA